MRKLVGACLLQPVQGRTRAQAQLNVRLQLENVTSDDFSTHNSGACCLDFRVGLPGSCSEA